MQLKGAIPEMDRAFSFAAYGKDSSPALKAAKAK